MIEILDLDGATTNEEIAGRITEETGASELKIYEQTKLRSGAWRTKALLPRKSADKLITSGKIRIGLTFCRIVERFDIPLCFNCLSLGHINKHCKEPASLERACFKCTRTGHVPKECPNEKYCGEAEQTGHTSNSYNCQNYRKLMKEKIENLRRRK
ncbi:uncharacterized protein LOC100906144 [Galendromus occidentalis]|uniref:Uncharacterized protein LOC100906144 n=1 Tax=Galendromus occidentalis TaxID=34638 RepID=A0AAJ6QKL7_9ACAR|nr:uncharacterized protein LOC100906144 [Galendromus occidentalis]